MKIGTCIAKKQRQHRTLHIGGYVDLRIVLVTAPRVSRSCEHFPDGFDLHLLREPLNPELKPATTNLDPRNQVGFDGIARERLLH
jgi:hypothetical protein